jgi:hypothetical protein
MPVEMPVETRVKTPEKILAALKGKVGFDPGRAGVIHRQVIECR